MKHTADQSILALPDANTTGDNVIQPGQFRLSRIQVVNWGTFSNYIDVPVARKGFLITGMSGSGKSTLIDAISSVLVPPGRVDFNAAAQQNAKRGQGRNIVSYIRGAWRRREDSATGEIATTYLRPRATYTIIGLTYDDGAGTAHTLAALYYLKAGENAETDVAKYFVIFPGDQNLDQMHSFLKTGIDKRKIRAAFPAAKFNTNHNAFAAAFSRELGISTTEALLLLHRTQSAKSLSSLDSLFREYMLDQPKTFEIAKSAVERFDELRTSYEKVQDVRQQIETLDPLQKLVTDRTAANDSKMVAEEIKNVLPAVRDQVQAEHLKAEIMAVSSQISTATAAQAQAKQRVIHAQDAFNKFVVDHSFSTFVSSMRRTPSTLPMARYKAMISVLLLARIRITQVLIWRRCGRNIPGFRLPWIRSKAPWLLMPKALRFCAPRHRAWLITMTYGWGNGMTSVTRRLPTAML